MIWRRKNDKLAKWHLWYAWYPVRIGDYTFWMEWVERKYTYSTYDDWPEYREIER